MKLLTLFSAAALAILTPTVSASVIFDDFNVNAGHFTSDPNNSGSSLNDAASSVADRVTTNEPFEGDAHQQLVINWEDNADAGTNTQIRHLSGGGTIANNTPFSTSAGEDGWIGFYVKTTTPGWTAQIWIEGPENNGGVPKSILADGLWHLYEWNLDDETGGPDGWGAIAGIIGGDADVQAGSYTIDSIIFRDGTTRAATSFSTLSRKATPAQWQPWFLNHPRCCSRFSEWLVCPVVPGDAAK